MFDFSDKNIVSLMKANDDSLSPLQKFVKAAINKTFFIIAHGQYNPKFKEEPSEGEDIAGIPFTDMSDIDLSSDIVLGKVKLRCSEISKAEYTGRFINSATGSFIDGEGDTARPDPAIFTLKKNQFIYGTIPNVYTTVQPNIKGEEDDSFFRARDLESILNDIIHKNVEIKYEAHAGRGGVTEHPCLYTPLQLVPNISVSTNFENPGEEGAMGIHYCPRDGGTSHIKNFGQPTDIDTINSFIRRAWRPTPRASAARYYFPIINMVIPLKKLCEILIPDGGLIILPLCFPIRPEIPICGDSMVVPVSVKTPGGAPDPNVSIYEHVTDRIKELQRRSNEYFNTYYYEADKAAEEVMSAAGGDGDGVSKWSVVSPELAEDDYGAGEWLVHVRQTRSYLRLKEHRKIFGIIEIMMDVYNKFEPVVVARSPGEEEEQDAVVDHAKLLNELKELYDKDSELSEKMQYLKVGDDDEPVELDKRNIVGVVDILYPGGKDKGCEFDFPDIKITDKKKFIIDKLRNAAAEHNSGTDIDRNDIVEKIKEWAKTFSSGSRRMGPLMDLLDPTAVQRQRRAMARQTKVVVTTDSEGDEEAGQGEEYPADLAAASAAHMQGSLATPSTITILSYNVDSHMYRREMSRREEAEAKEAGQEDMVVSMSREELEKQISNEYYKPALVKVKDDFKKKVNEVQKMMKRCGDEIRERMVAIFEDNPPEGGWLHYVTELYTRTLDCSVESGDGGVGSPEIVGPPAGLSMSSVKSSKKKRLIRKLKGLTHKRKPKTKSRRRSRTKSRRRSRTKSKRRSRTKSKGRSRTKSRRRSRTKSKRRSRTKSKRRSRRRSRQASKRI